MRHKISVSGSIPQEPGAANAKAVAKAIDAPAPALSAANALKKDKMLKFNPKEAQKKEQRSL